MKKLSTFILLILLTTNIFSLTIKVSVFNDIYPISFINENGEPDGIYTDIIKRIAMLEGWNIEWHNGTWNENYNALLNNEIDLMVGVIRTKEREDIIKYNENIVMTGWTSVYTTIDSKIENVLDLEGKRIGLMYNDQNARNFRELTTNFNINYIDIVLQDYESIIELIVLGELDAGVFFNLYKTKKEGIIESAIMFKPSSSYYAINKESDNQYILNAIDTHINGWKRDENSYYYQMYDKWFNFNVEKTVVPVWFKYSLYISALLILTFLLFIFILKRIVLLRTRELKELNENLEFKVKESSNKLIDSEKIALSARLVTGIAHEINAPISIGITTVSHLKNKSLEAKELFKHNNLTRENLLDHFDIDEQFYEIILNNLGRAVQLINNFKQISSDNIVESKRVIDLKDYIEKIITSLTPEIKKANFIIGIDLDEIIINTYPDIFTQILINFIMNSKTHAFTDDSILPHIKISLKKYDNLIELIYEDNGNGIKEENINSIFEPFYSTNKIKGNVGLGLAIVNNLVKDKLEGSIKVESEINKYTKFTIEFPIKEE